jgi:hypothetical protein
VKIATVLVRKNTYNNLRKLLMRKGDKPFIIVLHNNSTMQVHPLHYSCEYNKI